MGNIAILVYIIDFFLLAGGIRLLLQNKGRFRYYANKDKALNYIDSLKKFMEGTDLKKASRKRRVEKEIYEAISFLRNILTLNAGKEVRGDVLMEKLAVRKGVLQPVYGKMLGLTRLNRASEAVLAFNDSACPTSGKELASLLIKWDEMNPEELGEILISIQRAARERRTTEQKKRDELISDLVYLPVVLNVLVIFINFLYVSFFLDQQEMLMQFF